MTIIDAKILVRETLDVCLDDQTPAEQLALLDAIIADVKQRRERIADDIVRDQEPK